jgi:hypothetical protein
MEKRETIKLLIGIEVCLNCKFNITCNDRENSFNICAKREKAYSQKRLTCNSWQKPEGAPIKGELEIENIQGSMFVVMDSVFLQENVNKELHFEFDLPKASATLRKYNIKITPRFTT